jgi:hypothetical protein
MHAYQIYYGNVVDFYFHWFQWFGGEKPGDDVLVFKATGLAASYALFGLVFFVIAWKQRVKEIQSGEFEAGDDDSDEDLDQEEQ